MKKRISYQAESVIISSLGREQLKFVSDLSDFSLYNRVLSELLNCNILDITEKE